MRSPRRSRRRTFGLALLVTAAVLAACTGGPADQPSPIPRPSPTIPLPSPLPTTPLATTTIPSPSPPLTTAPQTTSPAGTSPSAPDPRTVAVRSLVRPNTRPARVVYADLDGDGVEDIALQSVAAHGGVVPQSYLDAFLYDGNGSWRHAWSATGPTPPGAPGAPAQVLATAQPGAVSQDVDFLAPVDVDGNGSSELAVGVLNLGAGPGPLDVWVIGFGGDSGPTTEFWEETVQDGTLLPAGETLRLQTPSFAPDDPACCPSRIEHQTIGFDPASGRVKILERSSTPVG